MGAPQATTFPLELYQVTEGDKPVGNRETGVTILTISFSLSPENMVVLASRPAPGEPDGEAFTPTARQAARTERKEAEKCMGKQAGVVSLKPAAESEHLLYLRGDLHWYNGFATVELLQASGGYSTKSGIHLPVGMPNTHNDSTYRPTRTDWRIPKAEIISSYSMKFIELER